MVRLRSCLVFLTNIGYIYYNIFLNLVFFFKTIAQSDPSKSLESNFDLVDIILETKTRSRQQHHLLKSNYEYKEMERPGTVVPKKKRRDLELGSDRVFVHVDIVLVDSVHNEFVTLWLHPCRHKRGQVQPRVTVKH